MIAKPSSINKEKTFFKIFLKEFPSLLIFIRILPYYVYIVLRTTKHVHFVYFFHNSIFDYLTVNNNEVKIAVETKKEKKIFLLFADLTIRGLENRENPKIMWVKTKQF